MAKKESPIHVGHVLGQLQSGKVIVWIPTANSIVPMGFSQYIYQNTGSQLYGQNLNLAKGTSYECLVASPLSSGTSFTPVDHLGASTFDSRYRWGDPIANYVMHPDWTSSRTNGVPPRYTLRTDNPALEMCACVSTLSVAGGNPIPTFKNFPKGIFPRLVPSQKVLVAFYNSSINPIVFASVHSQKEWACV